ncbi:hypothetical protein QBC46DRAFT_388861 [Diplogelasinospora grovesii]|uniref:Uncharacterized protein n=1 Tax=Diplogelasinospora grovesii TaxID=303347 RepID=A0AAN6N4M7_9PEZI|nr:hypothetical protein QBC46DRAFT_388861 [Diplogelasinospora grovesii]
MEQDNVTNAAKTKRTVSLDKADHDNNKQMTSNATTTNNVPRPGSGGPAVGAGTGSVTVYNPQTGAYDEQKDYVTASGIVHHHREKCDAHGNYLHRDVDVRPDGSRHTHRVSVNPSERTRVEVDTEFSAGVTYHTTANRP